MSPAPHSPHGPRRTPRVATATGYQLMAGFSRVGTTSADLHSWYSTYGAVLIPGSRVFLHISGSSPNATALPAIVVRATRQAGSAAWHAVEYDCEIVTSFSEQYQLGISRVRATPLPQIGGGAYIASAVSPTSNFFTPLDSFLSVLQIFLCGDWGLILEYMDAGLRYRGFSFVLIILSIGRTILLSTYTAFVIVWIAKSAVPSVGSGVAAKGGVGNAQMLGDESGQPVQSRKDKVKNIEIASKLDGIWSIMLADNSLANSKVVIRHISEGEVTMRSQMFEKNPVRARVDGPGMSITIQVPKKGKQGSTMGRIVEFTSIHWDYGQVWKKTGMIATMQAAGLNVLPNALNMKDTDSVDSDDSNDDEAAIPRFPLMSHAAPTHTTILVDPNSWCVWRRSAYLESLSYWCIENCCPIQTRGMYDYCDKIQVPCIQTSAVYAAVTRWRERLRFAFNQRVNDAQVLYQTIQELSKNKDARNVLEVDLPSLTVQQLNEIFQDRNQKVRIQQKVDLYLGTVIDILLQKREALQNSKLEYTANKKGSSAWHDDQIAHVGQQISRLEDTKSMIRYDLYSCLVFPRTSSIRKQASAIAKSKIFNAFIFLCIILNIISQSFDSPYLPGISC
jgi:hypothetical protein